MGPATISSFRFYLPALLLFHPLYLRIFQIVLGMLRTERAKASAYKVNDRVATYYGMLPAFWLPARQEPEHGKCFILFSFTGDSLHPFQ